MKTNNKISLLSILNEQSNVITSSQMSDYVEAIGDALDGWVTLNNLKDVLRILTVFKGKTHRNQDAYTSFLKYYKNREYWGGDFRADVEGVGTTNLGTEGLDTKEDILNLIDVLANGTTAPTPTPTKKNVGSGKVKVNFPSKTKQTTKPKTQSKTQPKSRFRPCTSFPFAVGCQNDMIAEIQSCISIPSDGKFGKQTLKALTDLTYDMSEKKITKEIYNKVKESCGSNRKSSINTSTPNGFFNKLSDDGYIVFDEDTQGDSVLVYDGPTLSKSDANKLNTALQSKGFSRLSPLDKNYGSELVYKIVRK